MSRILPLITLLALALPLQAAEPWHLADWKYRAAVTITTPSTDAGCDVGGVQILCQGRAKPDGSDYRVVDAAGKELPFQLMFHDASRYSLISFRCADPKATYFVYFGNDNATASPNRVVVDPKPGSGAPTGVWVPQYGFVLETRERPRAANIDEEKNPENVEDLTKLLAASARPHGARYQRAVSDGYNPFGPSEYYVSLYRGWIRIPKAGKYRFCTASNEASFSFLDGKTLIHWPGRHTAARGARGEFNAVVELSAGMHYLEYYQEEVTLEQMAFLGWRESGEDGMYSPIPEAIFTAPHTATVQRYESKTGPILAFEPHITDTIWPIDRSEGQYTRVIAEIPPSGVGPKNDYEWSFGDGTSAKGAKAEHIYLSTGKYVLKLASGDQSVTWPLEVFEIEHVTTQFQEGRPKEFAALAREYDRAKLSEPNLRELIYLLAESEAPADAVAVGKVFFERFPQAKPTVLAPLRRIVAESNLRLGSANIDEAIRNYQASLTDEMPGQEQLEVLRRLVNLVGLEREEYDKAIALLPQIEKVFKTKRLDDEGFKAYRQSLIAIGDVYLWQRKSDEASAIYRRVEALRGQPIPPQVRAAKLGSYPDSLEEYLDHNNYGAAIDLIEQWEETFPTDKLNGQSFFWRGKTLVQRGQPKEAVRYLQRAVSVTIGAPFESEARWLLAVALEQSGRADDAKKELAKLLKIGFDDEFVKKARLKLLPPK